MALSDTDEIHVIYTALSAEGPKSIFSLPSSALRNHVFCHMCEFVSANQSNVEKKIEEKCVYYYTR